VSVKLVFLGTGSGKPTPRRGVSSVALFRGGDMLMFDCGESTQIQLARSNLRPGTLSTVFITHFHGDHVNGLPGLLGSFTLNSRTAPIDVVGPVGLKKWFASLKELRILWPSFPINVHEVSEPGVVWRGDGYHVEAQPLKHRITTWGYRYVEEDRPGRFDIDAAKRLGVPAGPLFGKLQSGESIELEDGTFVTPDQVLGPSRPGLTIAYCTDTSPCEGAVKLSKDADVVIHEATYPAGEERLARKRGHSTAADAAQCAKRAGARKLVLTHISQKHQWLDRYREGAQEIFENTVVARDLLEVEVPRRETR
jgi:ribonuclease Z